MTSFRAVRRSLTSKTNMVERHFTKPVPKATPKRFAYCCDVVLAWQSETITDSLPPIVRRHTSNTL